MCITGQIRVFIYPMNTRFHRIEVNKRNYFLGIFLWGLCVAAADAQTPTLSPPALPPLSGLPTLATAPQPDAAPSASALPTPQVPALPPIPGLGGNKPTTTAAPDLTSPLADLPPPLPESSDIVKEMNLPTAPAATEPATDRGLATVDAMPALALPVPPPSNGDAILPPTPSLPKSATSVTAPLIPPVAVVEEKPKIITWQTKLAPTVVIPQTNFNYRRQILPPTISRVSYDRENQHLPPAVMREDYAGLLFLSVSRNDVETTRTILNAGNYLNATNQSGETPLALANRVGARNVAALLVARGARI